MSLFTEPETQNSEFITFKHYDGTMESIRKSDIKMASVGENPNTNGMYGQYEAPYLISIRLNDGTLKRFGYNSLSSANKQLTKLG